ncbi:MAG: thermonuclease family protein, partial [Nitrososphaeraceae archaeon]
DTIDVVPDGHLSIRFLGIDTPEISLQYPNFVGDPNRLKWLSIDKFEQYLIDPFSANYQDSTDYKQALGSELIDYLKNKLNEDTAKNHSELAMMAQRKLEDIVQSEVKKIEEEGKRFRFFMAFADDVMDRYGRFLCYLDTDRDQSDRNGQLTYNEQMLQSGLAVPYFIWPNVDPFIGQQRLVNAIPDINNFQKNINKSTRLKNARDYVKKARESHIGIFGSTNPLKLLPFELRYLSRRQPPDRYVIDLSSNRPKLLKPTQYYIIKNLEDRLFIPEEYVPLFTKSGYEQEL